MILCCFPRVIVNEAFNKFKMSSSSKNIFSKYRCYHSRTHFDHNFKIQNVKGSQQSESLVRTSRLFSSKQSHNEPKDWKRNGTPEIVIGTTILSLLAIDQYLQSEQSKSRQQIVNELDKAIQFDKNQERQETRRTASNTNVDDMDVKVKQHRHPLLDQNGNEQQSLFTCVIRHIPKYFDGTKSLQNVRIGDVVQVLEEQVGPDKGYHLCRITTKKYEGEESASKKGDENISVEQLELKYKYGWFPISCLEKQT